MPTSDREEALFAAALEKLTPAERAAYLEGACGTDHALRERIEALLAAHDASDGVLDAPPYMSTTAPPPLTEKPGAIIGPYKLLQQIGEGGMGVVYMVEQERPVRRVGRDGENPRRVTGVGRDGENPRRVTGVGRDGENPRRVTGVGRDGENPRRVTGVSSFSGFVVTAPRQTLAPSPRITLENKRTPVHDQVVNRSVNSRR